MGCGLGLAIFVFIVLPILYQNGTLARFAKATKNCPAAKWYWRPLNSKRSLPNNNGCGQYALIGVRLLFEGGHYNIHGLAAGGYYSRAATIRGRHLIEEIL